MKNATYQVYRNLTKDTLSVKLRSKVVAHSEYLMMMDATFVVSKSGVERIRRQGKKYVVATIRSLEAPKQVKMWTDSEVMLLSSIGYKINQISFNPYKNETAVYKTSGLPFTSADMIFVDKSGKMMAVDYPRV